MNVKMSPKGILHNPLFVYAVSYAVYICIFIFLLEKSSYYGRDPAYDYILYFSNACCLLNFFGGRNVYIHKDDSNFFWYITIFLTLFLQLWYVGYCTTTAWLDIGGRFLCFYPTVCLMLEYVGYKFFNKYKIRRDLK